MVDVPEYSNNCRLESARMVGMVGVPKSPLEGDELKVDAAKLKHGLRGRRRGRQWCYRHRLGPSVTALDLKILKI